MTGALHPEPGRPAVQGVYDALRGGHMHLEPDWLLAEAIRSAYPLVGEWLAAEARFAGRAVIRVASAGIGQYIGAAAGTPREHGENLHEIVRRVVPGAVAAYAGCDPYAIAYRRGLAAPDPGVVVVDAAPDAPAQFLYDPAVRELIDFSRPVCVTARMALHFLPRDAAGEWVADLMRPLAAGSCLIVSAWLPARDGLVELFAPAGRVYRHAPGDMGEWLEGAGLEVLQPGIVGARAWPLAGRLAGGVGAAVAVKR